MTNELSSAATTPPNANPSVPVPEIRRILVPLDFSAHAMNALRYATGFARQSNATLIFVHVTEPVVYPSDFGYAPLPPNALEENFQRDARERLEAVAGEQIAAGLKAQVVMRVGKPYYEIAEAARELEADLIVITTHGYAGLTHVLLGSTAERVVRHAPCPVLVVREQARKPHAESASLDPAGAPAPRA